MGASCKMSPVVFRRSGNRIEEVRSKLYANIKEAVQDRDTAWKMWAYTKTAEFKKKYKDVEYDELGEVTFPSLIKALGLENAYNEQKGMDEAARDYGFKNQIFNDAVEVVNKVNEFNSKEDKYVAVIEKEDKGYTVSVLSRTPANVSAAREQSYNNALTGEIINLMRSIGFDVGFVNDPKYNGIFDPSNASIHDGLVEVIRIAKGEKGEEALPEEFAHFIIEGLQNHPLVQRLLSSITYDQLHEILGNDYEAYYREYDGDTAKIKKEVAGKMLAQYIKDKGTINPLEVSKRKNLLSKVWNWAKNLFSKITKKQLDDARNNAHNAISDIYNLIAAGDKVPLIDKHLILEGDTLYHLKQEYSDVEKMARAAIKKNAKMLKIERQTSVHTDVNKKAVERHVEMREALESDNRAQCLRLFVVDTIKRLTTLLDRAKTVQNNEKNDWVTGVKEIRDIARLNRRIAEYTEGYQDLLQSLSVLDDDKNMAESGIESEGMAKAIAKDARAAMTLMNNLQEFKAATEMNIIYNAARTQYRTDKARGIGDKRGERRDEIMGLQEILDNAQKDLNWVDRWMSAMSDADDSLLTLIDGLVKNQQYERDLDMIEIKAQIDKADADLRKAGYTSDFMYEMKDGIPTGRIISIYDFEAYNESFRKAAERVRETAKSEAEYRKAMTAWKVQKDTNGNSRLISVYVNPEYEALKAQGRQDEIPPEAITEMVPNPKFEEDGKKIYGDKTHTIENLKEAQKIYYNKMTEIKRQMMSKIPHAGQYIYKAVYISKDFVEGILDNRTGSPVKAVLENFKKKYTRRPDEIGFGVDESFSDTVKEILESEKDSAKAAKDIIRILAESVDTDIYGAVDEKKLTSIIERGKKKKAKTEDTVAFVIDAISASNFYQVETDFTNHRIKRLPIYYTRGFKKKDMHMLSTDFSATLTAYSAMAVNYEKMDEVVDILEVARDYMHSNKRGILEYEHGKSVISKFSVLGKIYKSYVEKAGNGSSIAGRLDDYIDSVVYEERKLDEGSFEVLGVEMDTAKVIDAIKDYTGLLGLGFNLFSTVSNIAVGKLQQWIEAVGGEYFNVSDYAKAIKQYTGDILGCLAEMNSPIKKNKLSLLIQMFDPMGEYFESLRDESHSKNAVSRILGNNALAYIGMNAGEHLLHCQTMLAILNHIKVTNIQTKEQISLYDALEVRTDPDDGITRLEMKEGYAYERDIIDKRQETEDGLKNKNYGRPILDENGKIKTELVPLEGNDLQRFLIKKKRIIRKVNDSLNGAFSANDKGAIHRKALGRLLMQFRQWMPAHYMRRFARAHYDNDLEQWREGYYRTVGKLINQMGRDILKGKLEYAKVMDTLSEHEKANLRRATTEISLFYSLLVICRLGGKVKDRDRSWLNKMALYQIHRMYLEVGASMPGLGMVSNMLQLLQKPAPTISTLEKFNKVLHFMNMFDEIQTGRYQGWSEWQRDAYNMVPALGQITKAIYFDDSMFSMFENDN